jgi:hypothetical protein
VAGALRCSAAGASRFSDPAGAGLRSRSFSTASGLPGDVSWPLAAGAFFSLFDSASGVGLAGAGRSAFSGVLISAFGSEPGAGSAAGLRPFFSGALRSSFPAAPGGVSPAGYWTFVSPAALALTTPGPENAAAVAVAAIAGFPWLAETNRSLFMLAAPRAVCPEIAITTPSRLPARCFISWASRMARCSPSA